MNFYSGGDTTREAFGKHIQEFSKVYGILNSLQSTKADSTAVTQAIKDAKTELNGNIDTAKSALQANIDSVQTNLTTHINSSSPHPNWKLDLSDITGNLPANRISGTLGNNQIASVNTSSLNGSIPASMISGTFSTDKISGLESYVKGLGVGTYTGFNRQVSGSNVGILEKQYFMTLNNNSLNMIFVVNFASTNSNIFASTSSRTIEFGEKFEHACIAVIITGYDLKVSETHARADYFPVLQSWDKNGFTVYLMSNNFELGTSDNVGLHYIAIGY